MLKELLFRLYVRCIRPHTSRALYKLYNRIQPTNSTLWKTIHHMPLDDFSAMVNTYEYLPEIGNGLLDYSFAVDNPNYFFSNLKYGRDCGSWARLYYIYGLENGYNVQEVIITTRKHVAKDSHVVCILEKDNVFYLCDYKAYYPFDSFEDAVYGVTNHWRKYTKENLIWEKYNGIRS